MARRHRKPDPAFDLLAEHEGEQKIAAADALHLGERQQRRRHRRGRMDHRRHMGVAEVEHVGARRVEEGRAQGVDALATADNCRLLAAGEWKRATASAISIVSLRQPVSAKQRNSSASAWPDARPAAGRSSHRVSTTKLGQLLGNARIVQHIALAKAATSIDRPAQKRKLRAKAEQSWRVSPQPQSILLI